MTSTQTGRLADKIALVSGGAGIIGEVITRRFLSEGASVAITGRNLEKLNDYRRRLVEEEGVAPERVLAVRMDGSRIDEVRAGVAEILERLGHIDVLVNNAGSAGPRRALTEIPLTADELQAPDRESLQDALGNVVGITWNLTRAVAVRMAPGSSIINVSAIISRTEYYGCIPHVVPKAAVNALGDGLARELGERGIRLNTIYPGPIESEGIRSVFQTMDTLTGAAEGSTAAGFLGAMRLNRPDEAGAPAKRFPTPLDVANTAVFLASDESAAFAGHAFEVTHGMDVPAESRTTFASRPGLRAVDASGMVILICAGDQVEDALDIADVLRACRATLAIGFRDNDALHRAEEVLRNSGRPVAADIYGRPTDTPPPLLVQLDPLDPSAAMEALNHVREALGAPHHALALPARGVPPPADSAEPKAASLAEADDAAVQQLLRDELGVVYCPDELELDYHGRRLCFAHGDGWPPSEHGYRLMKRVFRNRTAIALFRLLSPDLGFPLARWVSGRSRGQHELPPAVLNAYAQIARRRLRAGLDLLAIGHLHTPRHVRWPEGEWLVTGDWFEHFSYAVVDDSGVQLRRWRDGASDEIVPVHRTSELQLESALGGQVD